MSSLTKKYEDGLSRCTWPGNDPIYLQYHDEEWGVPVKGENALFEAICLEGFQAGLSWITILKRREGFRKAFHNFEIAKVAKFTSRNIEALMKNEQIIRNRAKIVSAVSNAKIALKLETSLEELIWSHAPKTRTRKVSDINFEYLVTSQESEQLSKSLRKLGFSFVGPTTMYAMMQAIGMVNDHAPGCFRRSQLRD